ncbi:MAG: hypothetical protein MI861_12065 [Pirellulales bacterium]|nr:hypothetical protein [Pirellulales bacterium]
MKYSHNSPIRRAGDIIVILILSVGMGYTVMGFRGRIVLSEAMRDALAGGPLAVLVSLLDIAILGYLIYQLVRAIRGTRAMPVVFGLAIVTAVYFVAGWIGLKRRSA